MDVLHLTERELRAMCGCYLHMAQWAKVPVLGIDGETLTTEERDELAKHLREFLFPKHIDRPVRVRVKHTVKPA